MRKSLLHENEHLQLQLARLPTDITELRARNGELGTNHKTVLSYQAIAARRNTLSKCARELSTRGGGAELETEAQKEVVTESKPRKKGDWKAKSKCVPKSELFPTLPVHGVR